jgi:sugar lactone lactonase YvrE
MLRFAILLMLLMTVMLSACGHSPTKSAFFSDPTLTAVWPPPPEQPRIRLIKVFKGADEFLAPKGRMQSFLEAITGEQSQPYEFMAPAGIVSDGERYIYVADPSSRLVHRFDFLENEITYLTHSGTDPLASPVGVALDSNGNCYVTDSVKAKVYKYNSDAEFVGVLGAGIVEFQRPAGIAIAMNDYKYVVDVLANKVLVFDQSDRFISDFPNTVTIQNLNKPVNIAVDRNNNVYVTDSFNFSVKVFDSKGNLLRVIGNIGDSPGSFSRPKGVAVDSDAHIYIVDANFDNFQIFNQMGQLLLYVGSTGKKPGQFFMPNGIFIDREDRIYVSDSYNQRVQIFQYIKDEVSN